LVQLDLRKEATLRRVYGVVITPAMLAAEARRIDAATQAPGMLAEIKTALDSDSTRFANAFVKPNLVERLLRERFDNDDAIHAPQRRRVEQTRNALLAAKQTGGSYGKLLDLLKRHHPNAVIEIIWQLGARPTQSSGADEIEIQRRFGSKAQILSAPPVAKDAQFYFQDLPPELQTVLRVQLRGPADVSAVIETPGSFLLYVLKQKTGAAMSVASLSLPKRNYERWLEEQTNSFQKQDSPGHGSPAHIRRK
jgi:hypothetical protein